MLRHGRHREAADLPQNVGDQGNDQESAGERDSAKDGIGQVVTR
jgi:hypothetical protein